jgi:hypothetical protein
LASYTLSIKKVILGVKEFHLMRKVLLRYFLPLILPEKIDHGSRLFFELGLIIMFFPD